MFETWEELEESIKGCNKCKLYQGRQNIVFGTGNKKAKIINPLFETNPLAKAEDGTEINIEDAVDKTMEHIEL